MTKWILRCSRCGNERSLDVAFDMAAMGGRIYLYCKRCGSNTEHIIMGYWDEGIFISFEEAVRYRFKSFQ